jgi:AcrR family transcriptional regulator
MMQTHENKETSSLLTISYVYLKFIFEIFGGLKRIRRNRMRKPRSDGLETRQRLLAAACEIFAAKGFREATTAEICRKAGANAAAINYHFGGKDALYVASWRYAFEKSLQSHPPDGGVSANAAPEERLRGRIFSIMQRIVDPDSHEFDIVHKEMASPTGLLAETIDESLEPIRHGLASVVRELLGENATEQQVRLCRMSIKAQCFGPLLRERRRKQTARPPHPPRPEPLVEDVDTLADHVTRFSLAGIRQIRLQNAVQPPERTTERAAEPDRGRVRSS